MLSTLEPYGRDHKCSWDNQRIALGANLSHSFPEDQFDQQPLWSQDRSVCIVADVRLDNRADLTRQLDLVHPETLSDSSILLTAWLRWGDSCLDHLLGAFAFAIWAPGRGQLFAARATMPASARSSTTTAKISSLSPPCLRVSSRFPASAADSSSPASLNGSPASRTNAARPTSQASPACPLDTSYGHYPTSRVPPVLASRKRPAHPVQTGRGVRRGAGRNPRRGDRSSPCAAGHQPPRPVPRAGLDSSSVTASAARLLAERGESPHRVYLGPAARFQRPRPARLSSV